MTGKKITLFILIIFIMFSGVLGYNQLLRIQDEREVYLDKIKSTPLFINGEGVKESGAIYRSNERTFILVDVIEAYMPIGYRMAPSKKRVLFSKEGIDFTGLNQKLVDQFKTADFDVNLPVLEFENKLYLEVNHLSDLFGFEIINNVNNLIVFTRDNQTLSGYSDLNTVLRVSHSPWSSEIRM